MLKIFHKLQEVDFYQLMQVYAEGNLENAQEFYPHLPEAEGILQAEQDFYAYLQVFFSQPGAIYAVWDIDCRYVSALRLELYRDGFLLSALETAPGCRRKGYASELIRKVIKEISFESDIRIYSHVNKKNKASLAVHSACGFERIAECAVYLDGSVSNAACTLCYSR